LRLSEIKFVEVNKLKRIIILLPPTTGGVAGAGKQYHAAPAEGGGL